MNIPEGKYLGSLCKRGHNWNGIRKSLRYKSGNCIECFKEYQKEYGRKYRQENREKFRERQRKYEQSEKGKKTKRKYQQSKKRKEAQRRYRQSETYKLNRKMSRGIGGSLKGTKAGRHWESLVEYNLNQLIKHLKKTIPEGYS